MASSTSHKMVIPLLLCFTFISATTAGVICEDLPQDLCAFSISAASKRCLLERNQKNDGATQYECQTSEVVVDRTTVGISSDSFLESQFTASLCAPACYQNCPNIVDLYFNLAAGEGTYLPDLCAAQRVNPHRAMVELLSSGAAAGPVAGGEFSKLEGVDVAATPAASPMAF